MDTNEEAKTSKEIFVIRHGQGEHNVLWEKGLLQQCFKILDPQLTKKGEEQAAALQNHPLLPPSTELIVCSPLRRTIETCCIALENMMKQNPIPVILHPDLQEIGAKNCNTACPKDVVIGKLLAGFPEKTLVDTSFLTQTSHIKEKWEEYDGEKLKKRFGDFLQWLWKRPEKKIGIVAHHHSILFITGISFMNCELRQFYLSAGSRKLTPRAPLLSTCDSELSEADLAHCKSHVPLVRERGELWGVTFPERLR